MPNVAHLLEVADLTVRTAAGVVARLPELALDGGGAAALFGPSGSGKSTLLAAMFALLQRPGCEVAGKVMLRGEDFEALEPPVRRARLRGDLAFLPQDAHRALDPLAPVGRQVAEATGHTDDACIEMLARLGIADARALAARTPHAISGGQAQRVLLAIAFLRAPALVVVDEPTASLDGDSYTELVAHLRALLERGSALLMATHDARLVRDLQPALFAWRDGAFVRAPAPELPWPVRQQAPASADVVLEAHGVGHAFGGRRVLDGVDFACVRGEVVAIVGASGAGKTTLVRILAGHLRPTAGTLTRHAHARGAQLVCQDAFASLTPGAPLARLLAEAHEPTFDAEAGAAAVALPAAVLQQPRERMSGGEQRRAALLRALAVEPDVLLLDEPTASLDRVAAVAVLQTVLALQRRRGLALVLVTHDLEMARAVAHRVLVLRGGRLCPA